MTEVQFAKQFLTTLDSKNTKYQNDHVFDPKTFQLRIPYTLPKLPHPQYPLPPKRTPTTATAPGSEPVSKSQTQTSTVSITLKSNRNPTFTLNLPTLPNSTPIATLKSQIQTLLSGSVPLEKIKILHNKKPIPASKATVQDVLAGTDSESSSEAEFGVMVMGGATDPSPNVQTVTLNNEIEAAGPGSENAAVEAATGINPDAMVGVQSTPVDAGAVDQKLSKEQEIKSEAVQPGESSGEDVLKTKEFWDDLQGFLEQRLRDTGEAVRLRSLFEGVVGGK